MGLTHSAPATLLGETQTHGGVRLIRMQDALADIRAGKAEPLAREVQALLAELADSSVVSIVNVKDKATNERFVTRDDLREAIELAHGTLAVVGVDCYGCQLGKLGRELLQDTRPLWSAPETIEFMRKYVLGVCGFIDDTDAWNIDDRVLARIVERVNKAEAVTAMVNGARERGDFLMQGDETVQENQKDDDAEPSDDITVGAMLPADEEKRMRTVLTQAPVGLEGALKGEDDGAHPSDEIHQMHDEMHREDKEIEAEQFGAIITQLSSAPADNMAP